MIAAILALLPPRAAQAVAGVTFKAVVLAICAAFVCGMIGYGLWWIDNNATLRERADWETRMARAEAAEHAQAAEKARKASEVAAAERAALESELALAHEAVERIGKQLAGRPRSTVYPKAIIPELNR